MIFRFPVQSRLWCLVGECGEIRRGARFFKSERPFDVTDFSNDLGWTMKDSVGCSTDNKYQDNKEKFGFNQYFAEAKYYGSRLPVHLW